MQHLPARLLPPCPPCRPGEELPGGVTEKSSVAELKAACKEWGLAVGGTRPVLWQRLLDQVGCAELWWVECRPAAAAGMHSCALTRLRPAAACAAHQVEDSEEGPDGEAPRHCIVSGATRAELRGYSQKRISQSKAKASRACGRTAWVAHAPPATPLISAVLPHRPSLAGHL